MNEYVCKLGEFSGSDYLEFRKGNSGAGRKFLRQDSLYVLDSAFFFFLERIFREIITFFDMFETVFPDFFKSNISIGNSLPKPTFLFVDAEETFFTASRCTPVKVLPALL